VTFSPLIVICTSLISALPPYTFSTFQSDIGFCQVIVL
jgi:hypothetical protein